MFLSNNDEVDLLDRLRKKDREKLREKQKGQMPVMDLATLTQICVDNDGYETPELNDNLFAHFKGFQKIEGLEPFYNLKALWLESNNLRKIENLDMLQQLRCLYLNKNLLEKVENLQCLRNLATLDLSENSIYTIAGLECLDQLTSLNLAKNRLEHVTDIAALTQTPSITNLDLSHNQLSDPAILTVFETMIHLRALRLTGNEAVSKTKYFRKTYITSLPQLGYLDRPIFDLERAAAVAWKTGGAEAEAQARAAFVQHEHDERRRTLQEFRDWQAEIRAKKQVELQQRQAAGDVPPDPSQAVVPPYDSATQAQARQDALYERASVQGNGIKEIGSAFWATEAQRNIEAPPSPEVDVESAQGSGAVDQEIPETEERQQEEHEVEPLVEPLATTSVESQHCVATPTEEEAPLLIMTPASAVLSPPEVSVLPPPAPVLRVQKDSASAYAPLLDTLQVVTTSIPAPDARRGPVERETWESLQQKAKVAPYLHKPPVLPSCHEMLSSDDEDDDTSIRPKTRSELLQGLQARRPFTNLSQLD
ncbi:hypothetical protein SPRG_07686 [Saprolegnia parasitica CBS 223.65]|uniref:Dynein assembly factor 1, axonemal homolog n=1 Tax=Saprolegnia parasitica (strain CBS 223.65) TaxID=695850 RepID=A0A067C8X6_SAPPC|nr:hypothetical protein SPRG_07686 [Saprolegnia parasitica CBS 223.65]KDO26973.1 hypothetical protein SPRG_07686 [Saprolegnia parasitica CBS 223.65]|eukprot:XP_012202354.1 hypothetical protein SPRG_07686 [Saprolegnia parasitica CBS 223.65]